MCVTMRKDCAKFASPPDIDLCGENMAKNLFKLPNSKLSPLNQIKTKYQCDGWMDGFFFSLR